MISLTEMPSARAGSSGAERVDDVEAAAEWQADFDATEPEGARIQPDTQIVRVTDRERDRRDRRVLDQPAAVSVVGVNDGEARELGLKEDGLCLEVRLHVLVVIEVILAEIGEDGLRQRRIASTRCMTRACELTSIAQACTPLERKPASVRCKTGASGVVRAPSSVPTTRELMPARSKIERKMKLVVRLAVRAGDTDGRHRLSGIAEELTRRERHRRATHTGCDDELGQRADLGTEGVLAYERRRAGQGCLDREVVSVVVLADDAAKERAGTHLSVIEGDVGYDHPSRIATSSKWRDPGAMRERFTT